MPVEGFEVRGVEPNLQTDCSFRAVVCVWGRLSNPPAVNVNDRFQNEQEQALRRHVLTVVLHLQRPEPQVRDGRFAP